VEDWAEIRRLYRSEKLSQAAIARRLGLSRNTVANALASEAPPRYERAPGDDLGVGPSRAGSAGAAGSVPDDARPSSPSLTRADTPLARLVSFDRCIVRPNQVHRA
jgi:lambda repressor-like predicted transcriptional regulator